MNRRRSTGAASGLPDHPLVAEALKQLDRPERLFLIKAPPGSGKTTLLLRVLCELRKQGKRLAVATQTNAQAEDITRRWTDLKLGPIVRFVSQTAEDDDRGAGIYVIAKAAELPKGGAVVVATAAKWSFTDLDHAGQNPFDVLLIDEAWQMPWASFAALPHIAPSFMLIGDPGQIQPIVTVETSRWDVAPVPPHWAAPQVLIEQEKGVVKSIDMTFRLPHDTAKLVNGFYDFEFAAAAAPGSRRLHVDPRCEGPISDLLDVARRSSVVAATLPMPACGTVPDDDPELAAKIGSIVGQLFKGAAEFEIDGKRRLLTPNDVGIVATHRVMLSSIREQLSESAKDIVVETPERWQGLERPAMIAVHPLSSVTSPSPFDLETGRLCVMASRHKTMLIILTRDHVSETLEMNLPDATQAPSQPDVAGRGHVRHSAFWSNLREQDLTVSLR